MSWESNALGWATVVRDSRVGGSAVAWFGVGARVVRGSSAPPKPWQQRVSPSSPLLDGVVGALLGRGASCAGRSPGVTPGGPRGSENAGMSNEWRVRIPSAD